MLSNVFWVILVVLAIKPLPESRPKVRGSHRLGAPMGRHLDVGPSLLNATYFFYPCGGDHASLRILTELSIHALGTAVIIPTGEDGVAQKDLVSSHTL